MDVKLGKARKIHTCEHEGEPRILAWYPRQCSLLQPCWGECPEIVQNQMHAMPRNQRS